MSAVREVTIVDMGLGNLRSVARAFERAGAKAIITAEPAHVQRASCVVVPGQGAFRDGARALASDLGVAIRESIQRGIPYFGICLGMQLLFDRSDESPGDSGLSIFAGDVRRIESAPTLKVPHMGWNEVRSTNALLGDGSYYYFVHSYHCVPAEPSLSTATVRYGANLCAAIAHENLFACQFHPEKSQQAGALLIEKFLAGATWS